MEKDYGKMTGLVLNGGGGKGAYQIGVLKALKEKGYLDDVGAISGVSIGTVNSIIYAMGDIELGYKIWDDIDMLTIFDLDINMLRNGEYYFSRDEMIKLMDKYVDFDKISNSPFEIFSAICNNEDNNYHVEYRKLNGESADYIRNIMLASTAMPIVYAPVEIDGKSYRDGGICDNEPVKPLYDLGIKRIIVIGMTEGKIFNYKKFPDAEIIAIYPSFDLGDTFSGTLNFTDKAIEFREMLGYKDGLRAINTKFKKDSLYIKLEKELAINDYNEIMNKLKVNKAINNIETNIAAKIDKINKMAEYYDKF